MKKKFEIKSTSDQIIIKIKSYCVTKINKEFTSRQKNFIIIYFFFEKLKKNENLF